MTRLAGIDCGTNTVRLLIAEIRADGSIADVDRRMEVVRLGEGVDRTGLLGAAALERTLAAVAGYARRCAQAGVQRVRFVATSAVRDARNGGQFTAGVRQLIGVEPEVISGTEEAALSFTGAVRDLPGAAPFLVVDIGGGSTEFVLGSGQVEASRSVDLGSVRLTERYLAADPPTRGQLARAGADVRARIDEAAGAVPLGSTRTLVGVAGTVTTLTAHALRLPGYLSERVHRARLPIAEVLAACDQLIAMPRQQRAALPYLHPGRVDVIGAGALIWRAVLARVAAESGVAEVVTSEHDLLDGIVLSLLP